LLPIALTSAAIAPDAPFRRELAGGLLPPEGVAFDDRTLLYDVFRSADDRHAYLLGPPAIGVEAWFHTLIERSVAATTPVGWFQNDRHMRGWVTAQLDRIDVSDEHLVPQSLVVQPNLSHLSKVDVSLSRFRRTIISIGSRTGRISTQHVTARTRC
jgi:hypothetical protein